MVYVLTGDKGICVFSSTPFQLVQKQSADSSFLKDQVINKTMRKYIQCYVYNVRVCV